MSGAYTASADKATRHRAGFLLLSRDHVEPRYNIYSPKKEVRMEEQHIRDGNGVAFNLMALIAIAVSALFLSVCIFFVMHMVKYMMIGGLSDIRGVLLWSANDAGAWGARAGYATITVPFIYLFEGVYRKPLKAAFAWYAKVYVGVFIAFMVLGNAAGYYAKSKRSEQQSAIEQPIRQQRTQLTDDELMAEINKIPELSYWMKYDKEKFEYAVSVDDQLRADAAWDNRPISERFRRVTQITMEHFGM